MGERTDDGRGLGVPSYPQMRMWLRPCSPTCEAVSDKKLPPNLLGLLVLLAVDAEAVADVRGVLDHV